MSSPLRLIPLLCAAIVSTTAVGQTPAPLPFDIRASYLSATQFEFSLFPSDDIADVPRIRADISFDTMDQEISLEWFYQADGAESGEETNVESVGYQPTAICLKAGRGPVFFVAGYAPVTGHVIVEKWTIVGLALASSAPGGGVPQSGLSKLIRKDVIYLSADIDPIRAMAYSTSGSRLFLLGEYPPNAARSLDPVTGIITFLFDSTTVPELTFMRSAKAVKILPSAPDGGGCAILLYPWRGWNRGWSNAYGVPDNQVFYLMRDEDCDGSLDESNPITFAEYRDNRDYPQTWDIYWSDN